MVLPKFKLEKTYNLIDYLRSMGIEELFNGKGDYSGISDEKITINRVFTPHFTSSLIKLYHQKHGSSVIILHNKLKQRREDCGFVLIYSHNEAHVQSDAKALRVLWSVRNRLLHRTNPKGFWGCVRRPAGLWDTERGRL